jgi:hypothetical protein
MSDVLDELKRSVEVYKEIIKHLEGHLKEKYDETDAYQCKMLKRELKRVRALIKSNVSG